VQWLGWCFLFFPAQVIQDPVNGRLVFNAGIDPGRSTTTTTDGDIDIENTFEQERPVPTLIAAHGSGLTVNTGCRAAVSVI